jgi:hypothetical protein
MSMWQFAHTTAKSSSLRGLLVGAQLLRVVNNQTCGSAATLEALEVLRQASLRVVSLDCGVPVRVPVLDTQDSELTSRDAPTVWASLDGVVVIAPQPWRRAVLALVPGIYRSANGCATVLLERHQDVCVVVARRREANGRMPEHLAQRASTAHGWRDARAAVVQHALFREQRCDLVVQAVVDAVGVAVDEVDDLILVDEALQNALSIHIVTSPNGQSHGSAGPAVHP